MILRRVLVELTMEPISPAVRLIRMRTLAVAAAVAFTTLAAGCAARSTVAVPPATDSPSPPTAVGAPATVGIAGSAIAVQTTASQTPSPPSPTLTGSATVTLADDGSTVLLHRGQSLAVVLEPTGMFSWHVPTVTGAGLLQESASGGYPDQQPARATFVATQSGTATLQAVDDTACLHATPACLPPQRQWQIKVIVA